jgi:hypothetical protein
MCSAMDSASRATLLTNDEASEVVAQGSRGTMSVPREPHKRSAGVLRSVVVISMNCSASTLPPGNLRSVSATEQAELVISLRMAAVVESGLSLT